MALILSNAGVAGSSNFVNVTGIEFTMSGTNIGQTYLNFEAGASSIKFITTGGGSVYVTDSSHNIVTQEHGTAANTEVTIDLTSYPTACKFFVGSNTITEFIAEY